MGWAPTPDELAARIRARKRASGLRDGGATLRAVAEALTAEGYPTKSGKPWHAEGVRRLLAPWADAWQAPETELDWRPGSPGRRAYGRMHLRVRRARGPATAHRCAFCAEGGTDKQADVWAIRHDTDGKDVNDYLPLCDRCHTYYDRPVAPEPPSVLYPLGLPGDGPGDPTLGQRRAEQQRAKTHCPHGHEYTPENTYTINRAGGRTARQCRTCMREQREARRKGA